MLAFWQEALHYVQREPPDSTGVFLKDPLDLGPNLNLSFSGEGPLNGYRLHLDLYCQDAENEVKRLLVLGARIERLPLEGEDFVTLSDPDGNLFDVIKRNGVFGAEDYLKFTK